MSDMAMRTALGNVSASLTGAARGHAKEALAEAAASSSAQAKEVEQLRMQLADAAGVCDVLRSQLAARALIDEPGGPAKAVEAARAEAAAAVEAAAAEVAAAKAAAAASLEAAAAELAEAKAATAKAQAETEEKTAKLAKAVAKGRAVDEERGRLAAELAAAKAEAAAASTAADRSAIEAAAARATAAAAAPGGASASQVLAVSNFAGEAPAGGHQYAMDESPSPRGSHHPMHRRVALFRGGTPGGGGDAEEGGAAGGVAPTKGWHRSVWRPVAGGGLPCGLPGKLGPRSAAGIEASLEWLDATAEGAGRALASRPATRACLLAYALFLHAALLLEWLLLRARWG